MTHSSTETSRRDILGYAVSGAAALSVAGTPVLGAAGQPSLATTLADFASEILKLSPEQATSLGLDKGAMAGYKAQLSDVSPRSDTAWLSQLRSMKQRMNTLNTSAMSEADKLRLKSISFAVENGIKGAGFTYGPSGAASGFGGGARPYIVSQQDGAVTWVPEFLNSQHQIATKEDAEAYLARASAMAKMLDQESRRITHDAGIGVMPPRFIATTALGQLRSFRAVAAAEQGLVTSLVAKTTAANIQGAWAARSTAVVANEIYPAVERQISAFQRATARATNVAGVHRLPRGDEFYQWALRLGTTTATSAQDIHALGLEQNKAIQARMDTLLRQQGLTQGSVGARVQALNADPRFLYPDTDAGRADLIAYLNACVARMRPMMGKFSKLGLKADLEIKRVPEAIQDGAALGYMNFASLDGLRPAIYYVNLKSTSLWPKYQLPTLTAHEGIPGHTWQGAFLAERSSEIPLISSMMGFNAFVEGWALYAEQLMQEHEFYVDDPFGEIGYLQAQQFRACRLVVDTGLHALKWDRQKAVRFLTEETGRGVSAMTSEVDRYCASPGQACGYKMGHNEILRLRTQARAELGPKFGLADFNDAVVRTGGVPLTVLAQVIDAYIAGAR